jgi:hypothetical protein
MTKTRKPRNAATTEMKQIELTIEQYCSSMLIDECGFKDPQVRALTQNRIELLAHSLTAVLQAPAKVLQRDKVLATYPTTWWDAVKQRLGWKHERTEVRLNEHLIFPHVDIPHEGSLRHRVVYVQPRTTFCPYLADEPIDAEAP